MGLRRFALVGADPVVLRKRLRRHGAVARQIVAVRVQAQRKIGQAARDQRRLARAEHAHGDVGFAPQQIGHAVAGCQLDLDLRVLLAQRPQRGQQQVL